MDIIEESEYMVGINFDSVLDIFDFVPINSNNAKLFKKYTTSNLSMSGEGYAGHTNKILGPTNSSRKQVMDHALYGDTDLFSELTKMSSRLKAELKIDTSDYKQHVKATKRKRIRSGHGDEIDIHKVYQGQIDKAWECRVRETVDSTHNFVTILIDYVGNWNENALSSLWRAATALLVVDELERAGKSVKIVIGSVTANCFTRTSKYASTSIVVKDYNKQLSHERLAAMAHLGFFRSFGFACLCATKYDVNEGLGHSCTMSDELLPLHLYREFEEGHTRFVHIGRIMSFESAIKGAESAFAQIAHFSKS